MRLTVHLGTRCGRLFELKKCVTAPTTSTMSMATQPTFFRFCVYVPFAVCVWTFFRRFLVFQIFFPVDFAAVFNILFFFLFHLFLVWTKFEHTENKIKTFSEYNENGNVFYQFEDEKFSLESEHGRVRNRSKWNQLSMRRFGVRILNNKERQEEENELSSNVYISSLQTIMAFWASFWQFWWREIG